MAVCIFPDLLLLQAAAEQANRSITEVRIAQDSGDRFVQGALARDVREARILVPVMLDRASMELWKLGDDVGPTAVQLLALLHQWNQLVDRAATILETTPRVSALGFSIGHMKALRQAVEEAVEKVGLVADGAFLRR